MSQLYEQQVGQKLREMRARLESISGTLTERPVNTFARSSGTSPCATKPFLPSHTAHVDAYSSVLSVQQPNAVAPLAEEPWSPTPTFRDVVEEEPFDAFKAIQTRLREKMRTLRMANESDKVPCATPAEVTSPPPRHPLEEEITTSVDPATESLRSTAFPHDAASPVSTEHSPPPRDASVETAPPPAHTSSYSRSPVEVELSWDAGEASPLSRDYTSHAGDGEDRLHMGSDGAQPPRGKAAGQWNADNEPPSLSFAREKRIVGSRQPPPVTAPADVPKRSRPSPSPSPPGTVQFTSTAQNTSVPHRVNSQSRSRSSPRPRSVSSRPTSHRPSAGSRRSASTSTRSRSSVRHGRPWNDSTSLQPEAPKVPRPRPLWAEATVLEMVTGAELLAIFRMRGLVTSVGETGEEFLPSARCHAVYLTTHERDQLQMLRDLLQHRQYAERQHSVVRD